MRRGVEQLIGGKEMKLNKKAISPIIAVLLLIAIAVAAAIITYMWVMGFIGTATMTATAAQGQIAIESKVIIAEADDPGPHTDVVVLYIRNTGSVAVSVESVYVDNKLETITPSYPATTTTTAVYGRVTYTLGPAEISPGQLAVFVVTVDETATDLHDGVAHTVRVVCHDGTTTVETIRWGH